MLNGLSRRSPGKGLTKEAEISGKYIIITGFKEVKIKDVRILFGHIHEKIKGSHVQLFDANLVAGWEHLYFAALNALRAFKTGLNISKDLVIETLLYASGQDQIRKAVEIFGIKPSSSHIAVLIVAGTKTEADETLKIISNLLQGEICDEVLNLDEEKIEAIKKLFNISDMEVEAASRGESLEKSLVNLVIEHAALLAARR